MEGKKSVQLQETGVDYCRCPVLPQQISRTLLTGLSLDDQERAGKEVLPQNWIRNWIMLWKATPLYQKKCATHF